jgi:hypothetical protein
MTKEAKSTEVAKKDEFQFALVTNLDNMDEETKAELEDELDDLEDTGSIDCRRIKLPTGKSKAFEVESDDENDPDMEKEVRGVILFTHKMNSRWEGDYNSENKLPVCSSWDAKQGVNIEDGTINNCDTCPYNQFAEDGSGKSCKNMRRIYLMRENDPHLYLLTVPPTSLKNIGKQLKKLTISTGTPYTKIVVSFKLESAVSKSGIDFAKVNVEKVGVLNNEQWQNTKQMRETIKTQYKTVTIDGDYQGGTSLDDEIPEPPAVNNEGFMDIPEGADSNLPFK